MTFDRIQKKSNSHYNLARPLVTGRQYEFNAWSYRLIKNEYLRRWRVEDPYYINILSVLFEIIYLPIGIKIL